jgi:hypothetical protein
LLSRDRTLGLKWTTDLLMGGLLWLAIPFWLAEDTERKVTRIGIALVGGSVIAACVGLGEVALGTAFDQHLRWFKVKPTTAGPYLRLSGTFEYANIAAQYLELALPFALAGIMVALRKRQGRVSAIAWLLAADVLLAALLLTYTRGALLGLGVAALAIALASRRRWRGRENLRVRRRWLLGAAANLLLVLGIVVASGPPLVLLRLTSESDQSWYRASYRSALPTAIRAGRDLRVPVTVTNPGPLTWYATGAHSYHLSYHWLYASRRIAMFEGLRSALPSSVLPGGRVRLLAFVRAPNRPGRYLLVWDMVQENVTWFSFKSASYQAQPVRITGLAAPSPVPAVTATKDVQTTIPSALPQPTRGQLWAAALRMLAAHPLLGVGPAGYRLNYGDYARPKQRSWDTHILANSLPVEIFADLGLLGGGLFWVFLAALLWPLILRVSRGVVANWWQLALIGAWAALLGHGLVDYMLGSDAIFMAFWILCGLAATMAAWPAPDAALGAAGEA